MFINVLLFILFSLLLVCILNTFKNVLPPPFMYKDKQILYVNQPLSYIKQTEVPMTSIKENDIVNLIEKDVQHKNIKFVTNYLGDSCKSSKDCPDELICSSYDDINFKCNRRVPENQCYLQTCKNKIGHLGDSCGGITENMLGNDTYCSRDENLKCVTSSLMNNASGVCAVTII